MHRRAVGAGLHRLAAQVALGVAGEREGDHQRRRHDEAEVEVGMHAAGEVAVARQHRDRMARAVRRAPRGSARQRAGVADAGRAAVADDVEAERRQVVDQARRARGRRAAAGEPGAERGLDPGGALEARARAPCARAGRRRSAGAGSEVLVQLVIAAMATGCAACPRAPARGAKRSSASAARSLGIAAQVLRPPRAGDVHADGGEVDLDRLACSAAAPSGSNHRPVRLRVGLDRARSLRRSRPVSRR